jgi:hypothetical protein
MFLSLISLSTVYCLLSTVYCLLSTSSRVLLVIAHQDNPGHDAPRRLRLDEFASARPFVDLTAGSSYSGRRVVIGLVLMVLFLWGVLFLVFRDWRTRYRARAAFGATQVATAIDPLAAVVPEGVSPEDWRQAVADTHRMLVTITSANLLDRAQMEGLRAEIAAIVARARPDSSRAALARLWDDLAARAGPILDEQRHPRPKLLGSRQ